MTNPAPTDAPGVPAGAFETPAHGASSSAETASAGPSPQPADSGVFAPAASPAAGPSPEAGAGSSADATAGPGRGTASASSASSSTHSGTASSGAQDAGSASRAGAPTPAANSVKPGQAVKGVPTLLRGQWDSGQHYAQKLGDSAAKKIPDKLVAAGLMKGGVKLGARALPVLGSLLAAQSAYSDFSHGNLLGGILHAVGVIPGPIGWVGFGAGAAWDHFHRPGSGYGIWDAPDGTHTHMLPAGAADAGGVQNADASLTDIQRGLFDFLDGPNGSVWNEHPPKAVRLDTPEVQAAVHAWLKGIADVFAQADHVLQSSGEPYMLQYREKLAPQLAAMAKLPTYAKDVVAQLTSASDAAGRGYQALLDANRHARTQLAQDGVLCDPGPATGLTSALKSMSAKIDDADQKLSALFAATPPTALSSAVGSTASHTQKDKPKDAAKDQAPVIPAAPTAPVPSPTAKQVDDLNKLLAGARNPGTPMGAPPMPHAAGMPMGAGMPHHGGPGMGTPLGGQSLARPHPGTRVGEDLDRDRSRDEKSADKPRLGGTAPENRTVKPVAAPPGPGTAAPAAPAGKAATAGPGGKPAEAAQVDVKGHKVKFPDAKTAKLGQLLAGADPNHPLTLSDAAAQAGLVPPVPGQDPGQQVSPAQAKPGDLLVAGDRRYLMLGDGRFYDLDQYKVVAADSLPKDFGTRGGYFHLLDPVAGAPGGPVSGPTPSGVAFDVAGGTGQVGPVDTSPGHPAPTAPMPVSSSGTPGVPTAGTGGGPANAAATDTGIGHNVPSASPTPMDPTSVK